MEPPIKRAAYSDRTSYVMCEMSRLAYFKFEGGFNVDELPENIQKIVCEKMKIPVLELLKKSSVVSDSPEMGKEALRSILSACGYELVETYCNSESGAQAFLCANRKQNMAILAFRGTENLQDIIVDVMASLKEAEIDNKKFLIHNGYLWQYKSIEEEIRKDLDSENLQDFQLFITGHSLGGALAITATKFLANDSTGACYTFGSPPVGTKEFDHDIKTPIYRIINHVDIVPSLPNPIVGIIIKLIDWLRNKKAPKIFQDAQKYRQSGYGSYLVGNGSDVRLLYNVSSFDKLKWWINQSNNMIKNHFSAEVKFYNDHRIEGYSEKLSSWAETRK